MFVMFRNGGASGVAEGGKAAVYCCLHTRVGRRIRVMNVTRLMHVHSKQQDSGSKSKKWSPMVLTTQGDCTRQEDGPLERDILL